MVTCQSGLSCEVILILMLNVCGVIQYRNSWDWETVVLLHE